MVMEEDLERVISSYKRRVRDIVRNAEEYWNLEIDSSVIREYFQSIPRMWKKGEKSCRSAITIPIFEISSRKKIPTELEYSLISFDVKIGTFDELLDEKNLDTSRKGNLIMSNLMTDLDIINLAKDKNDDILEAVKKYNMNVMQIPFAENVNGDKFLKAKNESKELEFAKRSYDQRGRDIEIFYDLSEIYLEEIEHNKKQTKEQLLTYRKLELLEKDLRDIESDIKNDEKKIPVLLEEKYDDKKVISEKIDKLRNQLYHSTKWENENKELELYFEELIKGLDFHERI